MLGFEIVELSLSAEFKWVFSQLSVAINRDDGRSLPTST